RKGWTGVGEGSQARARPARSRLLARENSASPIRGSPGRTGQGSRTSLRAYRPGSPGSFHSRYRPWRLQLEGDALRERQLRRPVDGVGLAAHVGFPGIAAGFAAAAGVFFAAESPADFRAAGPDINVGDAAIAARVAEEALGREQVGGEHRRGEALRHVVVPGNRFLELVEFQQVKDGGEDLFAQDRHVRLGLYQCRLHEAAVQVLAPV